MTVSRRPLRSRDTGWARAAARWLAASRVTPNGISMAAIGFAVAGFALFWAAAGAGPWLRGLCLVMAALCCQGRLLCNLLDGMVAVEGGKGAADGPFWNEAPDRVADVLFLAGAGLAAHQPALGWAAAALAVGTAYLRELGRAEGLGADFSGPMAKPQRMAVLTGGAVLGAVWPPVLGWGLWLIALGAGATALRRSVRMVRALKARGQAESWSNASSAEAPYMKDGPPPM